MKYLLDTHTLLWSIGKSRKLSAKVRGILKDTAHEIYISSASLWEISLKYGLGKLVLGSMGPEDIPSHCDKLGYINLPIGLIDASFYHTLKRYDNHKDPFDRMLISQSLANGYPIVTDDSKFSAYDCKLL